MKRIVKYNLPIHLIGWAVFFLAPMFLSPRGIGDFLQSGMLWPGLVRNVLLVGLFYANLYYLTPVVLKRYGTLPFLLAIVGAVTVVTFASDWIHVQPPPHEFRPGPRPPRGFGGPFFTGFVITAMIASISSSIAFWNDWNKTREIEREQAIEKIASELSILKLQISPHFLFNTLNNIRWLIRSNPGKADEAVIKLSQLLRYILYQTNDEKVSLEKEVDNVADLILLQKMRLVEDHLVEFVVKGDLKGRTIVPLLFIPLVENLFKHGDLGRRSKISLEVDNDRLRFFTENFIRQISESGGIGVDNVRKRLMLHYPNRYIFNVSEKDGVYKVEMELLL